METEFATIPGPVDLIAGITVWSAPFFAALWPFVYVSIGIVVAALIIKWLGSFILKKLEDLVIKYSLDKKLAHAPGTTMTGAQANTALQGQITTKNSPSQVREMRH